MGCNSFGGNYDVKGGNLAFSQMISTMMACPEPQMTQEGTAFQVMNGTVPFEIQGNTLKIHDASGATTLILSRTGN